ncbi:MAG TPA: FAD-binding oxidoreductase [Gemmatimonadales bacterium]|jgi:FAD/FMN-containing dehydrogenase
MTGAGIRTDLPTRIRYSQGAGIYRIIPWGVGRPESIDELRALLALARHHGQPVIPRGAGSAMPGNNVGPGVILDLTALDAGRCVVDPDSRRATLSPSIPLSSLNLAARRHDLIFPVDPSSGAWATLGGMVSTNAAGPHTVRAGSVRNWVEEVTIETADGPLVLTRGVEPDPGHPVVVRWRAAVDPLIRHHAARLEARIPAVRKNSAGYGIHYYSTSGDLLDVVIGSEGTLGVLTGIVVRLVPVQADRASLRVAARARGGLPRVIERLRQFDPATMEFLDQSFLQFVGPAAFGAEDPGLLSRAGGMLLVDFEGDDAGEVGRRAHAAAAAMLGDALHVRVATDPREIEAIWAVRHAASPILAGLSDGRRSLQVIEDGCVPVARLAEYLDAIDRITALEQVDAVMFGHAGDGHVHVNLLPDLSRADWVDRVRRIFAAVSHAVISMGGTPSGEHGVGRLREGLLAALYGPEMIECFRAVKAAFDPDGRFNPGVILGNADPLSDLKVGADAAAVPAAMDQYLTAIESEARWGESRWPPH